MCSCNYTYYSTRKNDFDNKKFAHTEIIYMCRLVRRSEQACSTHLLIQGRIVILQLVHKDFMNTIQQKEPFAEIIESSLRSWQAQCWQWDSMPTYGSIVAVKTGESTHFGIVHALTTGSHDTQRTVFAYKKSEEQLKKEHPHIFQFLTSTISCLPLGYKAHKRIHYQLAPRPPKIHAFVTLPDEDDLKSFFSQEQYLHTLFSHIDQVEALDDLLLALIGQLAHTHLLSQERLRRFIETFSLLTANDYRRLKLFLQRVQPILSHNETTVHIGQ